MPTATMSTTMNDAAAETTDARGPFAVPAGIKPEHAEIIARLREAKLAKKIREGRDGLSPDELDGVAGSAPARGRPRRRSGPPAKGFEARRSRPPRDATRCLFCEGRINQFDGKCARCGEANPGAPDREPVRVARPEMTDEAALPALPEPAPAGRGPCPDCGGPLHARTGRCYACRPGGARRRPPPAPQVPPANPAPTGPDAELAAIAAALGALAALDGPARARAASYVAARLAAEGGAS